MRSCPLLVFLFCSTCLLAQHDTLVFATYAYSNNTRLENLKPLGQWLTQETNLPIKVVSYPSVNELIIALETGEADIAMMNTTGYLLISKDNSDAVRPLVNLSMGAQTVTNYSGCLIASASSGISSIKDLGKKGIKLALVSSSSTSGNLVPRLILNGHGIKKAEEYFDVYYAGTHNQVVQDVVSGKATVGGCGCHEAEKAKINPETNDKISLIASFNNIPLGPVVFRKGVNAGHVAAIENALLRVHEADFSAFKKFTEGWTEFDKATRFQSIQDKSYDAFRQLFGNNQDLWNRIR